MTKPFNFSALRKAVREAARNAFAELRRKRTGETFYAFALYTMDTGSYLVPTANSEEGLQRKNQEYVSTGHAELAADDGLRWSPCDWAYHLHGDKHFQEVQKLLDEGPNPDEMDDDPAEAFVAKRMKAFIAGFKDLDGEGFFGEGEAREQVTLLLMMGDQDDDALLESAKQLNPERVYKRFAQLFAHPTQGKFTEIGSRKVYEMADLAVSRDETILATVGDYHVFLFELPSCEEVFKKRTGAYKGGYSGLRCCALSPDGAQLAIGWKAGFNKDGGIERWSVAERKKLPALPVLPGGVWAVAYSPDSELLASGGQDYLVRLWRTATGECISELAGHEGDVQGLAFAPDGRTLVSSDRYSVRIWDVESGKQRAFLEDGGDGVALSPDGKLLAVVPGHAVMPTDPNAKEVRLWDMATLQMTRRIDGLEHTPHVVAFSKDGRYLATASAFPGTAELYDLTTGKRLLFLDPGYEFISALAFIDNPRVIAVTGRAMSRPPLLLWDVSEAIRS